MSIRDESTLAALRAISVPGEQLDARSPLAMDRRRFLQLVGAGLGAGLVAGPGSTLLDVVPGALSDVWAAGPVDDDDGILVVVTLHGGNDGLNTVVRLNDGNYRDQRRGTDGQPGPNYIDPSITLPLDARSGLHPELTEFKRFWDAGHLAIVEGVGHEALDFSHFNSMARWMSGRPVGVPDTGWLGRWLDHYVPSGSTDLYAAVEVGNSLPLHLLGEHRAGSTVPVGQPDFGVPKPARVAADNALFDAVRDIGDLGPGSWRGRIGIAQSDQLDLASTLSPIVPADADLPTSSIEAKLEIAARIINANLGMRVISVGFGDFDSHAGQPDQHPALLRELNRAIARFFDLLHPDWSSRVAMMTLSEFGRTSYSNDGEGTDHGSSAPQFLFGCKVKGGFHGQRPSLAGLGRWDRMPTHVDYRDYLGSVLDGWLGGGSTEVFGSTRQDLGLFRSGPSTAQCSHGPKVGSSDFVPINPVRIFDSRSDLGGAPGRLGPGQTAKVSVAGVSGIPAGISAVAVNISSIHPTSTTFLTAHPSGSSRPSTATLNPQPGLVVPNMSIVGVGSDGVLDIFNERGHVDITVDVAGYYRTTSGVRYQPLSPSRILDTRDGVGAPSSKMNGGSTLRLQVAGRGGVPATGADAVVINLTSIHPTTSGWVTAWPSGSSKPHVASLSYRAGEIVPNLAVCRLGPDGTIDLEASSGSLDLVGDVAGYFATGGAQLSPVAPARLLDTRSGVGAPTATLGGASELVLDVAGRGGVSAAATAVVLNVTGIRPSAQTYLTVFPTGEQRPTAANLNPAAGSIAGNLVIAKIGSGGAVSIYNERGDLDITADVTGYFS